MKPLARAACVAAVAIALSACSTNHPSAGKLSSPPTAGASAGTAVPPTTATIPAGPARARVEQGTPQPSEDPGQVVATVSAPTVPRGQAASISFLTRPGSTCAVALAPANVTDGAPELGPKVADSLGLVTWTWTVSTSVKPGSATATVSCSGGAQGQTTISII